MLEVKALTGFWVIHSAAERLVYGSPHISLKRYWQITHSVRSPFPIREYWLPQGQCRPIDSTRHTLTPHTRLMPNQCRCVVNIRKPSTSMLFAFNRSIHS